MPIYTEYIHYLRGRVRTHKDEGARAELSRLGRNGGLKAAANRRARIAAEEEVYAELDARRAERNAVPVDPFQPVMNEEGDIVPLCDLT